MRATQSRLVLTLTKWSVIQASSRSESLHNCACVYFHIEHSSEVSLCSAPAVRSIERSSFAKSARALWGRKRYLIATTCVDLH